MGAGSTISPRVLLVEDDNYTVDILRFFLEREGFQVVHAPDGRQAQELIESITPPNLLLLDMMLPHVSGLDLIAYVRRKADWRHVPIIVLTADATERNTVYAMEAGADDFLAKPLEPRELLSRLRRFLGSEI